MSDQKLETQSEEQQAAQAVALVRQRHEQELQIEREKTQHVVAMAQIEADRANALLRIQQTAPRSSRLSGIPSSTNLTLQELDKKIAASQTSLEAESWIEVKKKYHSQEQEQNKQLQRSEEERKENYFRRLISGERYGQWYKFGNRWRSDYGRAYACTAWSFHHLCGACQCVARLRQICQQALSQPAFLTLWLEEERGKQFRRRYT